MVTIVAHLRRPVHLLLDAALAQMNPDVSFELLDNFLGSPSFCSPSVQNLFGDIGRGSIGILVKTTGGGGLLIAIVTSTWAGV